MVILQHKAVPTGTRRCKHSLILYLWTFKPLLLSAPINLLLPMLYFSIFHPIRHVIYLSRQRPSHSTKFFTLPLKGWRKEKKDGGDTGTAGRTTAWPFPLHGVELISLTGNCLTEIPLDMSRSCRWSIARRSSKATRFVGCSWKSLSTRFEQGFGSTVHRLGFGDALTGKEQLEDLELIILCKAVFTSWRFASSALRFFFFVFV